MVITPRNGFFGPRPAGAAGGIITATLVAVVLPEGVPDRAYWMITHGLSLELVATPGLIVAVLIAATGR